MTILQHLQKNTVCTQYNSISELIHKVKTLETKRPQSVLEEYIDNMLKTSRHTDFAGASYDEAINLLEYGWEQQAEKLTTSLKTKIAPTMKQVLSYDVHGFTPSVPRYLQGLPTSMVNVKNKPVPAPIIDVFVNLSVPARVSAEKLFKRSIEILRVLHGIEAKGYRCNLYTLNYAGYRGKDYSFVCKVKDSSERLHIKKLAFPLSHPAMLRQIVFASNILDDKIPSDFLDGMGYVNKFTAESKGEYVINGVDLPDAETIISEIINIL